jgi:glutaredoxin
MKMDLKVLVYSWCPHCNNCLSFLKENKVKHKVIDIEKQTKFGDELEKRIGMRRCPHFILNGKWVDPCDKKGWSKTKTKRILKSFMK